jgi:hypothetical protein
MIDHPEITERLIAKLQQALPISALLPPNLRETLRGPKFGPVIPTRAAVTSISYLGDGGGILCKLDLGPDVQNVAYASITHLRFDARLPLAREIAAYQRRRVKHLRRLF